MLGCARGNPAFDEVAEGGGSGDGATSRGTGGTKGADGATSAASASGEDNGVTPTSGSEGSDGNPTDPTDATDSAGATGTTGPDLACEYWEGECTLFAQKACANGSKCVPAMLDTGWSAQCVPISGSPAQDGDACVPLCGVGGGADECNAGLTCWNGICRVLCDDTLAPCDGDDLCITPPMRPFGLCTAQCDPLLQDCGASEACVPGPGGGFGCQPAGVGQHGVPCDAQQQPCAAGFVCVDSSNFFNCQEAACCAELCDLEGEPCTSPDVCTAFAPPDPQNPNAGYCVYGA